MRKKKRRQALWVRWRGKIARVIGQGSDEEVRLLFRLTTHESMTPYEKYLALEGAIWDVWGERLADREEEAKARRKRAREQAKQEREVPPEPVIPAETPIPLDPAGSSWSPHEEIERGPRAPEHDSMSPDK